MPELPEVETTVRGIRPWVTGKRIERVVVRQPALRWPVSPEVAALRRTRVTAVSRRAKYLLLDLAQGQVLLHLGMSGGLRVVAAETPPGPHDHVDFHLDQGYLLRFHDPRRFGAVLWVASPGCHALLAGLGPEPLEHPDLGRHLHARSRGRSVALKQLIMDQRIVVGVGNIYAQESLFLAGIRPDRPAGRVSMSRYLRLAEAIQLVLGKAIDAGGTTLRDFADIHGKPGYFVQDLQVYGRGGEPCTRCGKRLSTGVLGQRSTVWCTNCQR